MSHVRLGDSGLAVSRVGVGCNAFGRRMTADQVTAVVHRAVELGVTLFDTAELYGSRPGESEELLGDALVGHRDDVVIATKWGHRAGRASGPSWEPPGSRSAIRRAVEGSLRRLRTDRIDLYQMHTPDPTTPIEETLSALDDLIREGKVRYIGSSNFAAWQVVDADRAAAALGTQRFVSAQNRYSLLARGADAELIPACEHVGVGLLPFYPLASGLLTGKYQRGQVAPEGSRLASAGMAERLANADWDTIEALTAYGRDRGLGVLDVAVGGLAARPGVGSVIAGVRTVEQVEANVSAGQWEPTPGDLAALDALLA